MAGVSVSVQHVHSRTLAAVRREVSVGQLATAWGPALDEVWKFLKGHPGLRTEGHNVFLYQHGAGRNAPMHVDFGVEVVRSFEPAGEVHAVETPAGEVAQALHIGRYDRLKETHDAIVAWCTQHHRAVGGASWEIYGDWTSDESQLETTVLYLLA